MFVQNTYKPVIVLLAIHKSLMGREVRKRLYAAHRLGNKDQTP